MLFINLIIKNKLYLIKNKYNLRNGFITPQTNESLRSDFNTLWNQLKYTYNLFQNRTEKSGPSLDD